MGLLQRQLRELCKGNKEGSHTTQLKRCRELKLMAKTLEQLGYRHMTTHSLKPKHVDALVDYWKAKELSSATIKKRLSYLRWWARKVDLRHVVARSNRLYEV